jgi:hypothetical protein
MELFSSGFENGDGFAIAADPDTSAEFGWDYSALGLPAAPNGSDTVGLRLASNITSDGPGAAAISVSPEGQSFTGLYEVQFDFWLNYHTSAGTTEYGGGAVAFDVSAGQALHGAMFVVNTDGDSTSDYLLIENGATVGIESGQYAIPSLDHAAPENQPLRDAFPGNPPPEVQNTQYGQVLVPNPDGTLGFGWHTMTISADTDAGTATFSIDGVEFGTISGDVSGGIALTQWDRFNSVAGVPELAFGVYDNLVVTQVPEPTSCSLMLLSILALAGGRIFSRRSDRYRVGRR